MKKILALLMTMAMVLGLAACGGSKEEAPKQEETKQEETKQDSASTTPEVVVQIAYENFPGEPTDQA